MRQATRVWLRPLIALSLAALAMATACQDAGSLERATFALFGAPRFGRLLVAVSAGSPTDRGLQAIPAGVAKVEIHLGPAGGAGAAAFEPRIVAIGEEALAGDPAPVEIASIPAGKALITVKVSDRGGNLLGQADKEVDVAADQTTEVRLDVHLRAEPRSFRKIAEVRVSTDSVVLNTMPPSGGAADDLPATVTATATVVTDAGEERPDLSLVWSTLDPGRVTVIDGILRTRRDAPEGTASVIVASADDPTRTATISVTITRIGGLDLGVR